MRLKMLGMQKNKKKKHSTRYPHLSSLIVEQISIYFNNYVPQEILSDIATNTFLTFFPRNQVNGQQYDDGVPAEEVNAIRALLQPENFKYEMHRRALENYLESLLEAVREPENDEYEYYDDEKRSIATMAKNGQLPTASPETEESLSEEDSNGHKRNLASMARSGMIGGKRNIQSLARQMNYGSGKRNIGSLMRNNMFPDSGKRNIGSVVRGYGKRNIGYMRNYGKRNVGTLARDWALPKFTGSKYMDGESTGTFHYKGHLI
jgi:hypothetical protein